ncbi:hypothetical protein GWI33_019586 [Rhynchophorus ferrugineus]|uniref:Uncharacterized protein n=1 Tax=Rhynchophorus ferrugineus TaxID=354439 RepID=A0A834HRA8_RHYFE|nr:hypothetical protein GWI33_019586 [Rhynchophorus ferrugineus]
MKMRLMLYNKKSAIIRTSAFVTVKPGIFPQIVRTQISGGVSVDLQRVENDSITEEHLPASNFPKDCVPVPECRESDGVITPFWSSLGRNTQRSAGKWSFVSCFGVIFGAIPKGCGMLRAPAELIVVRPRPPYFSTLFRVFFLSPFHIHPGRGHCTNIFNKSSNFLSLFLL